MSRADGEILILGLGNVLMGDDGVGVHVARALLAEGDEAALPPHTCIVDGGTLGLDLLPLVEDARALLLVDAVELGCVPGKARILTNADLESALGSHLSPHQVGAADLIAVARLMEVLPSEVALLGIQPDRIEMGLELSDLLRAALAEAIGVVRQEAWALSERSN